MVLLNSGFLTQKSENYLQFGHALSAIFASTVIGLRDLKNIGFKGRQIISLPGSPTCLGPAMSLIKHFFGLPYRLMTWDNLGAVKWKKNE
jgi:hypothetical protein